jgi:hypothetical protein
MFHSKILHILKYFFPILAMLLLAGCYEPKEGCLDISAANFAPDADVACPDDCCVYPSLRLRFLHQSVYADTTFNFQLRDSVYTDPAGSRYRVLDTRFFLSDVRLVRADGSEIPLSNRIEVQVFRPGGNLETDSITNDILLVSPALITLNNVGTLRAAGTFTALRFRIGLDDVAATVDPESLPAGHPMRPGASGMEWNMSEGFVFQQARFVTEAAPNDTITVTARMPAQRQEIELPANVNLPEGYHLEMDIRLDYLGWLRDISPATQTPETLLQKWSGRSSLAFQVMSIRTVSQ